MPDIDIRTDPDDKILALLRTKRIENSAYRALRQLRNTLRQASFQLMVFSKAEEALSKTWEEIPGTKHQQPPATYQAEAEKLLPLVTQLITRVEPLFALKAEQLIEIEEAVFPVFPFFTLKETKVDRQPSPATATISVTGENAKQTLLEELQEKHAHSTPGELKLDLGLIAKAKREARQKEQTPGQ